MTTKYKPYAAFGSAFIKCNVDKGDTRNVDLGEDGLVTSGYYFYTDGISQLKVKDTGEVLEDRTPGWLNVEHGDAYAKTIAKSGSAGTLEVSYPVDTEWFCISHKVNQDGLPNLSSVFVEPNGSYNLPNGTNMFLARGELVVKDKTFVGPCQIRVRSGDTVAQNKSTTTSYALLVK